jgi:hypothetical protein
MVNYIQALYVTYYGVHGVIVTSHASTPDEDFIHSLLWYEQPKFLLCFPEADV